MTAIANKVASSSSSPPDKNVVNLSNIGKKFFNFNIESLRGIAAVAVLINHAAANSNVLDPHYYPSGFWTFSAPGHLSVLLFFILSGYVIGIAHAAPMEKDSVLSYLKKRFIRIYPIYLFCFLLVIAVTNEGLSPLIIISHLTLTQGLLTPVLLYIDPSWSLTYEVAFYFLFIPISVFRLNPLLLAVAFILLGVTGAYFNPDFAMQLLPTYSFGFAFWLSGLALAKYVHLSEDFTSYATMVGLVCLFLALGILDSPAALLHQLQMFLLNKDLTLHPSSQHVVIIFRDLAFLPYGVVMLMVFAGKKLKHKNIILIILTLLPAFSLVHYFKIRDEYPLVSLSIPVFLYGASIMFFLFLNALRAFLNDS